MRKKRRVRLAAVLLTAALACSPALTAGAAGLSDGDSSYIFDYWGNTVATPMPYEEESRLKPTLSEGAAAQLTDMADGGDGTLLLADSANSCIWRIDGDGVVQTRYTGYTDAAGGVHSFTAPEGVWAADGRIYVADTGAAQIVVLDAAGQTVQIVEAPAEDEWGSTVVFEPVRLTTDGGGRMYVISRNQTQGIVQFSADGRFISYLGAPDVKPSAWDILVRTFGSKEMKARTLQLVPTEFTNLVCNSDGMVFAITETVTDSEIRAAVQSGGSSLPVRLLNPLGKNILKSNGYHPPVGDIDFALSGEDSGASRFIDVAVGPNGLYSLLDRKRCKIFTYDEDGELLYIFGGKGGGQGRFEQPVSLVYCGDRIAVLDQSQSAVILFAPTDFAQAVTATYAAHDVGDTQTEERCWTEIGERYGIYDLASLGRGRALFARGEYRTAMACFKAANNREYYSKAYKALQAEIFERNILWFALAAVAAAGLIVLLVRLGRRVRLRGVIGEAITCGGSVLRHPFDGFWQLKWEGKGTVGGATLMVAAAAILFFIGERTAPFLFSDKRLSQTNTLMNTCSLLVILLLWIVASWCLTTLFNGKGNMKSIYIYAGYCLTPYVLLTPALLVVGHLLTLEMASLYSALYTLVIAWCVLLLVTGTLTVHQFTLSKTLLMLLLSAAGTLLLIFLIVLCVGLGSNIIQSVSGMIREIEVRYS